MRRPGIFAPPGKASDINLMLSWRPGAITCYYEYLRHNNVFNYKAQNPAAEIIVRFQHPRNWYQNPEPSAVQYAQEIAGRWNELRPLNPYVCFANELNLYFENGDDDPNNQPMYETEQFYEQAGWWISRVAQVIKSLAPDMRLITPPYAPGRNEDGSPDEGGAITETFAGYDYLSEAISAYFDNTLACHAYWGDVNGSNASRLKDPQASSWYAFRWRRLLALCKTRYNVDAKIIIDEAGNFAAYDADFYEQITYFSRQTLNDPRVLALTYFLWEDPTFSPGNIFNVWTQYIPNLPAFTQRLAALPDITVAATPTPVAAQPAPATVTAPQIPENPTEADFDGMTIRLMFDNGHIETMPFERYLRAVVPAEMPALWPVEALKAQAVAARTYAANVIRRARYLKKEYDLRANPDIHQNYVPSDIHPRGDKAVLATKGLILIDERYPIQAVFSANCGGHTFNSEDVFKRSDGSTAPPTPYLRGVSCPAPGPKNGHGVGLCQHGAKTFAEMGLTYEKILLHYFTDVKLVPWEYKETVSAAAATVGATPPTEWRLKVERFTGFPIITGNLANRADIQITVTQPNGAKNVTRSGTKPEFGKGGFEATANASGQYILEFEGQRFTVQMDGKTTVRLHFSTGGIEPAPVAQAILTGALTDHRGAPIADRIVRLQSTAGAQTAATDSDGQYAFENLAAGTYQLTVPDSPISETVTLDGREFKTLDLQLAPKTSPAAPAISGDEWIAETEIMPGSLPLIVGDIGRARQPITVTAPSGAQTVVISGAKPEFGPGGFEAYTPEIGSYTLQFLGRQFVIPTEGKMLRVTFKQGTTAQAQTQARLVSAYMPEDKAKNILEQLKTKTAIGNLFGIEK